MNQSRVRISILAVTVLFCVAWGMAVWVYEYEQYQQQTSALTDREARYAKTRGETISADVRRTLGVMSGVPEVLATWSDLVAVLAADKPRSGSGPDKILALKLQNTGPGFRRLNQLLALAATDFSADVIWILNLNGDCIAASNYAVPASFVGANFSERVYFQAPIHGENGYQFAVGKVSHRPGLYFSAPVLSGTKVVGVVVAKIDIAQLAHHIDFSNVFLVDENGVAVLAEDQNVAMKAVTGNTIKNMAFELRRSIYLRDQFETLEISPWPAYPRLSLVGNASEPYIVNISDVGKGDLKIYTLAPGKMILQQEQEFLRIFLLITLCGSALIVIVAGVIWYSHDNYLTSQMLQLQHEELNQAQRLAKIGSWSYDYETNSASFSKALVSQFFMLANEPAATSSPAQWLVAQVHLEDRQRVEDAFDEGLKLAKSFSVEYRMVLKNGEVRNVIANAEVATDSKGQRIKMTGTCRDVTEEQHALRVIEDSENHLRKVLSSSLIGIIQGNDTGRVLDMNAAFMRLTGYTRAEVFDGRLKWETIAAPEYRHLDGPEIFGLSDTPAPFEMSLFAAGGERIRVMIGMAKIQDARREWVCFVLDLTERNRINELQSEFISVVSHELRTPLTSIRGALALLESGMSEASEDKKMDLIKIAHRNSQRLIKIVNDILDMEKLAAGQMAFEIQTANLTDIITEAVEDNSGFTQQFDVRFLLHAFPHQALVRCDPARMLQVITNLMSNAAKFSLEHGVVDCRLTRVEDQWRFDMTDHGHGIPPESRSKIFDTLSQARDGHIRQKSGAGLGLNIAKIMVEEMGGTIGFESEPGQGATFWLLFDAIES